VFTSSLLTPARASLPASSEFERLARAIERRRRSAHAVAREAIGSTRYAASVQALKNWVDGCEWRTNGEVEDLRRPIGELAPILLEPCRRRAKKRSRAFSDQTEEERHELRIALKKLRYAAELLGSLYDPAETGQFNQRIKRLQDDLGDINDLRVGRDIVASLAGSGVTRTGIGYAGRRMLAWHKGRLADNGPQLKQHLQQLFESEPFWRGSLALEAARPVRRQPLTVINASAMSVTETMRPSNVLSTRWLAARQKAHGDEH
jgi:CHAD domain-containing protein